MKALSLWQPWASAMQSGVKTIETRSWYTNYRGPLVICSALKKPGREVWQAIGDMAYEDALALPYGCALCVVDVVELIPTDIFNGPNPLPIRSVERDLGNYTPGRWAWITQNLIPLKRPVPVRGHQGLWNLDKATDDAIRAMM